MEVVIRADASVTMGSGHIMRCLTLADELQKRGAKVSFICRDHSGNLNSLLETKGFTVACLAETADMLSAKPNAVSHACGLGVSWEEDASETIAVLGDKRPVWLIVDHYALDRRWEQKLRPHVGKIMVIDDLADRPHDCDLLLDQNFYHAMDTRYGDLVAQNCRKLLGPKYALLRPEFIAARQSQRQRDWRVGRILVFFGGVDPTNETGKVLRALANIAERQFEVDVVVGAGNPFKKQIQKLCLKNAGFHYHCQIDNMAELMVAADLAIGAGGSTTWERCALGLPALVVTVAENQRELAYCAADKGLIFHLGDSESVASKFIQDAVRIFCSVPATLRCCAEIGLTMVDAKGVQRVAGILVPPQVKVRQAQENDCDAVHSWRNAEETRKYIFDKKAIPMDAHRAWFRNTLSNPNRTLLIGEISGHPVGVLRYDFAGQEALISVYLVPGGQGQGVGTELIRCGSRWLKDNRPEIRLVNAEVMLVNVASLRAFEMAGYRQHHVTYQEVLR
jgi:UDP-2,4-diacetamido-2,4,6-trideoxy-beta-L-altropyranose hydrolase